MQRWRIGSCALLALLLPLAAGAQEILLDFRETELARAVDAIGQQTGQRFIYDDSLRGTVTLSVPERVAPAEALRVLDAALLLHGFAAMPGPGNTRRIVRIESNPGSAPWLVGPALKDSEAAVVTLIRLQVAPVVEVAKALRDLAGKSAILSEDAHTNAILVASSEAQVRRLLRLARALDQASNRELRVMPLRYRDATEIEPMLETALADRDGIGEGLRIVADERTGSLVVEGRREDLERVHALLRTLDVPLPGKSNLHVVRVLNVDASDLAESLDTLLQDGGLARKTAGEIPVRVVVDEPTHSLVIHALPAAFAEIARVIAELDVPPQRVSVELTVVEVSLTGNLTLGFDSLLPLTGAPNDVDELKEKGGILVGTGDPMNMVGTPEFTETFVGRITTDPIVIQVDGPGGLTIPVPVQFGGVVRAGENQANFHTLIQPHLLMTSGDEHSIQAGDNIPVPVSAGATEGTSGVSSTGFITSVNFQRQDTGVDLRMTPTVLSDQMVALQLELQVSQLESTSPGLGPNISKRNVSATARLQDGQIALIAALRAPERQESLVAVPWLWRIPVLGQFFTIRHDTQQQRVLIVTAQPTVMGSPADDLARSIRERLAFERQIARTGSLSSLSDEPYALLIDTSEDRAAADAIADELLDPRWLVQVVPWTGNQRQYWDVYATGFPTLGAASQAAIGLRDAGWRPQLTVLPERLE